MPAEVPAAALALSFQVVPFPAAQLSRQGTHRLAGQDEVMLVAQIPGPREVLGIKGGAELQLARLALAQPGLVGQRALLRLMLQLRERIFSLLGLGIGPARFAGLVLRLRIGTLGLRALRACFPLSLAR